jgi:FkbM family methyltransferase
VCFEPAPKTYRVLLLNTEDDRQITCHKYGLSSENKTARMISYENNIGHATVVNDSFTSGCDIELRTLDSVLDAIIPHDERIRLLKIDVEGHEYEALMGATTTISKHRPLILIEQLSAEIKDGSSKVIQLLRDMGYQKFATLGIRSRSVAVPWVKPKVNFLLSKLIPYKSRFLGTEKYVELCDVFKVADYPFIIALPEWLYERQ